MSILSVNVLGDRPFDQNALLAFLKASQPRYAVVMDNGSLAQRVASETGVMVIYRMWQNDDNSHLRANPADYIRQRVNSSPPGSLIYVTNEPSGDYQRLNDWTLAAMKECTRLNRRAVIFNMSTGTPEPSDWHTLLPAFEYAYANQHLVGLHEYFDQHIATSARWHIGRFQVLQALAGERCPEILITELACAVGLDPHKGWREALSQTAYADELIQAGQLYKDAGVSGACVFSWGSWQSFDVSDAVELQQRVIEQNQRWNVATEVTWVDGTVRPAGNWTVNVRAQPNTSSAIVTTVQGEVVAKYAVGETWTRVQVLGVEGYIRNDVAIFGEPVVVPDDPVPDGGQTDDGYANALADLEQSRVYIERALAYFRQE